MTQERIRLIGAGFVARCHLYGSGNFPVPGSSPLLPDLSRAA